MSAEEGARNDGYVRPGVRTDLRDGTVVDQHEPALAEVRLGITGGAHVVRRNRALEKFRWGTGFGGNCGDRVYLVYRFYRHDGGVCPHWRWSVRSRARRTAHNPPEVVQPRRVSIVECVSENRECVLASFRDSVVHVIPYPLRNVRGGRETSTEVNRVENHLQPVVVGMIQERADFAQQHRVVHVLLWFELAPIDTETNGVEALSEVLNMAGRNRSRGVRTTVLDELIGTDVHCLPVDDFVIGVDDLPPAIHQLGAQLAIWNMARGRGARPQSGDK